MVTVARPQYSPEVGTAEGARELLGTSVGGGLKVGLPVLLVG